MSSLESKKRTRLRRKMRIRIKISGSKDSPRLTVYRSLNHIYAQLIDDTTGRTIVSASSTEKAVKEKPKFDDKIQQANFIGKLIGERAKENGIKKVVFDRNGYIYHGRIKAVSEGAREAGLDF